MSFFDYVGGERPPCDPPPRGLDRRAGEGDPGAGMDDLGVADPAATLAYSFGPENRYGHPSEESEEEHAAAGWDPAWQLRTGERTPRGLTSHQHGHIYWDVRDREARLPCGGACDLAPCRRA